MRVRVPTHVRMRVPSCLCAHMRECHVDLRFCESFWDTLAVSVLAHPDVLAAWNRVLLIMNFAIIVLYISGRRQSKLYILL